MFLPETKRKQMNNYFTVYYFFFFSSCSSHGVVCQIYNNIIMKECLLFPVNGTITRDEDTEKWRIIILMTARRAHRVHFSLSIEVIQPNNQKRFL